MNLLKNIFKTLSLPAIFLLSLGMLSCEDETTQKEFNISNDMFTFSDNGGDAAILITSSGNWNIVTDSDWFLVTPANGNGETECKILVDTSYLYDIREGTFTIQSGNDIKNATISQTGFKKVIKPNESLFTVPDYKDNKNAYIDIEVVTNVDFEIVIPSETPWITIDKEHNNEEFNPESIPRPRKIRFKYGINTTFEERISEIKLIQKSDGGSSMADPVTITVTQEGSPTIMPGSEGDSIAVVMLTRILQGEQYSQSVTSIPMINWDFAKVEEFDVENPKEGEPKRELRIVELTIFLIDTDESIPHFITYLTKIKKLSVMSNIDSYRKRIPLTKEITTLENLEELTLLGYGISSLPEEFVNLRKLKKLDLTSNVFDEIPYHIIEQLVSLEYLNMSNCRAGHFTNLELVEPGEEMGLRGEFSSRLFNLKNLKELSIAHNYFEGALPEYYGEGEPFPLMEELKLGLNFFTGKLPNWLLNHKNLGCWDPYTLIFEQNNNIHRDSNGKIPGFLTLPPINKIPRCPFWENK